MLSVAAAACLFGVACFVLHRACCMLHVACHVRALYKACGRMLHVACHVLCLTCYRTLHVVTFTVLVARCMSSVVVCCSGRSDACCHSRTLPPALPGQRSAPPPPVPHPPCSRSQAPLALYRGVIRQPRALRRSGVRSGEYSRATFHAGRTWHSVMPLPLSRALPGTAIVPRYPVLFGTLMLVFHFGGTERCSGVLTVTVQDFTALRRWLRRTGATSGRWFLPA
jgi:hypothetical protein